jgi:DNA-binding NarL/FixJ family response regulator
MTIKILLADDHRMVRQGLKLLLERQPHMKVVAEAEDGLAAVRLAKEHGPQVAIIDVSMPGLNGIEAARKILAHRPGTKVIGLSMYSDRRYVIEMLRSGALGYILKESAFDELVQAIATVMENQTYLSGRIADVIIKDYIKGVEGGRASAFTKLSNREREVLQQLAEGRSTKQIAAQMNLSIKTVETYRKKIMDKLNLYSLAELTKYAIREGITSL